MEARKKLLSIILVLAMCGGVCYGSTLKMHTVGETTGEESLFGRTETIYFWYFDDSLTEFVDWAAVNFGDEHNVHVIPVLAAPENYLEGIWEATLHSNQIPDVYLLSNEMLEKAYLSALASPVRDVAGVCNDTYFSQGAQQAVTYNGDWVAYPFSFDTCALIYNETYLEEWSVQRAESYLVEKDDENEESEDADEETIAALEGRQAARDAYAAMTDEEKAETAAKLAESYLAEGIPTSMEGVMEVANSYDAPELLEGIMSWDVNDIFYNYWFLGGTMNVGGPNGDDRSQIDVDNANCIAAMQYYQSLQETFYIEADQVSYDSVLQDFAEGKLLFTIGTVDSIARLSQAAEEGVITFDYGFATMPDVTEELPGGSVSVTKSCVVNDYSEQKDLANEFAAYLTTEAAKELYTMCGKAPACRLATGDNPALGVFQAAYAESVSLPKFLETENFWMEMEAMFSQIWSGSDAEMALLALQAQLKIQL